MRGWGAEPNAINERLVQPDFGWGDPAQALNTPIPFDYGWGSEHPTAYPSFLTLNSSVVADDGGYRIVIRGDFPRGEKSLAQRVDGYTITLVDTATGDETPPLYSSRIGYLTNSATNYQATRLECATPLLDHTKTYTVRVRKSGVREDVGTLHVERRTRTLEEYEMRSACPESWNVGARTPQHDTKLLSDTPKSTEEQHSNLYILIRSLSQSLAEFKARGTVTRLISNYAPSDTFMNVESTLGAKTEGILHIGQFTLNYSVNASQELRILNSDPHLNVTLNAGAIISYDPNI